MRPKFYPVLVFVLLILLCASNRAFSQVNQKTFEQIKLLKLEKQSRTAVERKISSQLLQAIREEKGQPMVAGVDLLPAKVDKDASGNLMIDINGVVNNTLVGTIRSLGGKIISSSVKFHALRAQVTLSMIYTIATLTEVKFIGPAAPARAIGSPGSAPLKMQGLSFVNNNPSSLAPLKRSTFKERSLRVKQQVEKYLMTLGTGSVTSQGDHALGADSARIKYGFQGEGIRIAILSDSYNAKGKASADVASGDLPGLGNPQGDTIPVTVLEDYPYGNDEGRAMLQIVHDLAPKAQLFFATAFTGEGGFASNIEALRNAPNNCDIIVDDVIYYDEPTFEDGLVAQAVNEVTANGALYFSSAGNAGSLLHSSASVYQADFNDAGSPLFSGDAGKVGSVHNFGTVASPVLGDQLRTTLGYYTLNWADPLGGSGNDYDLFLVDGSGNVKASSTNIQDGTQNPYEALNFTGSGTTTAWMVVVFKDSSAQVRAFNLNGNLDGQGNAFANFTNGNTYGHSCAAAAFGVAAADASAVYPGVFTSSSKVEKFSSDGPRQMFFNADSTPITPGNFLFGTNGGMARQKPDITAADGVVTTLSATSGLNPFYGTSAAAPHAGAIAALIKSARPSLTAAQVRAILTSTALDIEGPGVDINSGYGIVQAVAAVKQADMPPGNQLQFDGSTQYATVNTGTALLRNNFTVEAWVRPGDPAAVINIFSTRGPWECGFDMKLMAGNLIHGDIGDGTTWLTTSADAAFNYTPGIWYHIAYVVTHTGYTIYANGTPVGSGSFSGTPLLLDVNHNIAIGVVAANHLIEYFNGNMDEVRVYNAALTQANIQADMQSTAKSLPGNLQLYYNFDQPTGVDSLKDISGHKYTGTLTGTPPYIFGESYAMVVPGDMAATSMTTSSFKANWIAPITGTVDNYYLDVATDSAFTSIVSGYNQLPVTGTSQKVSGLSSGTVYYYRVRANKASVAGQGAYGQTIPVTTVFVTPTITSFTPGLAGTGTTVTITGTNFNGTTAVSFGGSAAGSYTVMSSTSIQAIVGTGATGAVSVTTPGGTATKPGFTYCTIVTPSVTVSPNIASPICANTRVTFTATAVNGGTPVYQWYKNNAVVGGNTKNYVDSLLNNNDSVWCIITSSAICTTTNTAMSNVLTYTVNPKLAPTLKVTINTPSTTVCVGTNVTFTATATNTGANPIYQWIKNNVNVGTNSPTYIDDTVTNNDSVICILTITAPCASRTSITSPKFKFTVNPIVTPSVTVTSNFPSPICAKTKVTFTANPVNAVTPSYQWFKNGKVVGGNTKNYVDSLLANNNTVWCIITSGPGCITKDTAKSNTLRYVVNPTFVPTIKIQSDAAPAICAGTMVNFTATITNGGVNPTYQWQKNGVNVGTNSSTYSDAGLNNSDAIVCVLTPVTPCATPASVTSKKLVFAVAATVPNQPSTIKGLATVSAGQLNVSYAVTNVTGNTYIWSVPPDVTITSGLGTYKIFANWGYSAGVVSVTAVNGCGQSTASNLSVNVTFGIAGHDPKDASLSNNYIRAYPNPVTGKATIEFMAATTNKYEAQVMNELGQSVMSRSGLTVPGLNTVSLDMTKLASAVYYVRLVDKEQGVRIIKLVKAK